jgi:hypothetical protein
MTVPAPDHLFEVEAVSLSYRSVLPVRANPSGTGMRRLRLRIWRNIAFATDDLELLDTSNAGRGG